MSKIKHISFDFWGTIAQPNSEFYRQRVKYLSKVTGKDEGLVGERIIFYKEQFEFWGKEWLTGIDSQTQTLILLKSLGITDLKKVQRIYEYLLDLFCEFPPKLLIDKTILEELKTKVKYISIISNTGFVHSKLIDDWMMDIGIDEYFESGIFSDRLGYFKPNPLIYVHLMENFNLQFPNEILHVGNDDSTDGELCRRTGMQYFKVMGNNYTDILKHV